MHSQLSQHVLRRAVPGGGDCGRDDRRDRRHGLAGMARPLARRPRPRPTAVELVAERREPGLALPIGGRSSPVVFGNRLYLLTADRRSSPTRRSGSWRSTPTPARCVWERRFSIYLSDVPQHRAGWASPAVDPRNRQHLRVHRRRRSCSRSSPDGKTLWDRSLPEEYGAVTTHGGRTTSPIIDGDKVILNALISRGAISTAPATATSRSTSGPARRSGSARRRRVTTTPTTRRRSSPTSTAAAADRRRHRRRVSRAQGQHRRAGVERRVSASARFSTARCTATASSTSRTAKRTSTRPRWG